MRILVAGAGHGGLAAAGLLAKQGARVTVVERCPEENLGYDWTDIFNLASFREAGIPLPEPREYHPAYGMNFYGPSRRTAILASVPPELSTESQMERRDILRHLIHFARDNGAEILFETSVERPLIEGKRVVGLAVKDAAGTRGLYADLVIDAAGMDSPVRSQLPEALGIEKAFRRDQYFTVFRAFYKSTGAPAPAFPFNVYFLPLNRKAVAWFASEGDYVDLLCGSFEDTTRAYAEEIRQALLSRHPDMGGEICRGGGVVKIPVRRPIPLMVADGYAAVGDAAAMTVPLNGSGITNAIRAGRLLAETVLAPGQDFTAAALWPFQVRYMRQYGAANASLDIMKRFVMSVPPETVDFLFDKHILAPADMNNARVGREIAFTVPDLLARGVRGATRLPAMLQLARAYLASQKLKRRALRIPSAYDADAVRAWGAAYEKIQ